MKRINLRVKQNRFLELTTERQTIVIFLHGVVRISTCVVKTIEIVVVGRICKEDFGARLGCQSDESRLNELDGLVPDLETQL